MWTYLVEGDAAGTPLGRDPLTRALDPLANSSCRFCLVQRLLSAVFVPQHWPLLAESNLVITAGCVRFVPMFSGYYYLSARFPFAWTISLSSRNSFAGPNPVSTRFSCFLIFFSIKILFLSNFLLNFLITFLFCFSFTEIFYFHIYSYFKFCSCIFMHFLQITPIFSLYLNIRFYLVFGPLRLSQICGLLNASFLKVCVNVLRFNVLPAFCS